MAGGRFSIFGSLFAVGDNGLYWSSTVSSTNARYLFFDSSVAAMATINRAYGYSVRCLKE
jgi:hypothetical protein